MRRCLRRLGGSADIYRRVTASPRGSEPSQGSSPSISAGTMASPRFLILLILLMVSITVTHQGIPSSSASCCTQLAKRIPRNMLQKVTKVQVQKIDGICHLQAIVLHVENQLKCMDPKNRFLQQWVRRHRPKRQ